MGSRVCGVCGVAGHDRRTCTTPAPPVSSLGIGVEDLETWWGLFTSGKRGKRAPGVEWTPQDTENLLTTVLMLPEGEGTPKILGQFLGKFGVQAKCDLGEYAGVPAHVVAVLAQDKSVAVRAAVASREEGLSWDVMGMLAYDVKGAVRRELADNPTVPGDVLEIVYQTRGMSVGAVKTVRQDVDNIEGNLAANPNCPAWLFEKLSKSKRMRVLAGVVSNPNVTVGLFEAIVMKRCDSYVVVREAMCSPHMTGGLVDRCVGRIVGARRVRIVKGQNVVKNWSEERALRALLARGSCSPDMSAVAGAEALVGVYDLYRTQKVGGVFDVTAMMQCLVAHPNTPVWVLEDMVKLCGEKSFRAFVLDLFADDILFSAEAELSRRGR